MAHYLRENFISPPLNIARQKSTIAQSTVFKSSDENESLMLSQELPVKDTKVGLVLV